MPTNAHRRRTVKNASYSRASRLYCWIHFELFIWRDSFSVRRVVVGENAFTLRSNIACNGLHHFISRSIIWCVDFFSILRDSKEYFRFRTFFMVELVSLKNCNVFFFTTEKHVYSTVESDGLRWRWRWSRVPLNETNNNNNHHRNEKSEKNRKKNANKRFMWHHKICICQMEAKTISVYQLNICTRIPAKNRNISEIFNAMNSWIFNDKHFHFVSRQNNFWQIIWQWWWRPLLLPHIGSLEHMPLQKINEIIRLTIHIATYAKTEIKYSFVQLKVSHEINVNGNDHRVGNNYEQARIQFTWKPKKIRRKWNFVFGVWRTLRAQTSSRTEADITNIRKLFP